MSRFLAELAMLRARYMVGSIEGEVYVLNAADGSVILDRHR